jgi:hypothetical protein
LNVETLVRNWWGEMKSASVATRSGEVILEVGDLCPDPRMIYAIVTG